MSGQSGAIAEAAKASLKDAAKFLFFNEQGTVLASNFTVSRLCSYAYLAPCSLTVLGGAARTCRWSQQS